MSQKIVLNGNEIELSDEQVAEIVSKANKEDKSTTEICLKTIFGDVFYRSDRSTIKEAVVERNKSGSLGHADLRDADLRDADLRDADLSGADLSHADLSHADLRGADLRGADLSHADLRDADLRGADLRDADLRGADLSHADLSDAKFYGQGGAIKLTHKQLPGFLGALGFILED